jgi:hypothetical protein
VVLQQFMLGPAGSGAPPHFHGAAINMLVYGCKEWMLYPPAQAFFSVEHVRRWQQTAGEEKGEEWGGVHDKEEPEEDDKDRQGQSAGATREKKQAEGKDHVKEDATRTAGGKEVKYRVPPHRRTTQPGKENEPGVVGSSGSSAHGRPLRCVQQSGDIMFVPDLWGHAVVNHQPSIAVAIEFRL